MPPERRFKEKSGYALRKVAGGVRRWLKTDTEPETPLERLREVARPPAGKAQPRLVQAELIKPRYMVPPDDYKREARPERGTTPTLHVAVLRNGHRYVVKRDFEQPIRREVAGSFIGEALGVPVVHNVRWDSDGVGSRMVKGGRPLFTDPIYKKLAEELGEEEISPYDEENRLLLDLLPRNERHRQLIEEQLGYQPDYDRWAEDAGRLSAFYGIIGDAADSGLGLARNDGNLLVTPTGLVGLDFARSYGNPLLADAYQEHDGVEETYQGHESDMYESPLYSRFSRAGDEVFRKYQNADLDRLAERLARESDWDEGEIEAQHANRRASLRQAFGEDEEDGDEDGQASVRRPRRMTTQLAKHFLPQAAIALPDPDGWKKSPEEYYAGALQNPLMAQTGGSRPGIPSRWDVTQEQIMAGVKTTDVWDWQRFDDRPLDVWYHGTRKNDFDPEALGHPIPVPEDQPTARGRNSRHWNVELGTFFTDDPHVGSTFAGAGEYQISNHQLVQSAGRLGGYTDTHGRIIPARLTVQKPRHFDTEGLLDADALMFAVESGMIQSGDISPHALDVESMLSTWGGDARAKELRFELEEREGRSLYDRDRLVEAIFAYPDVMREIVSRPQRRDEPNETLASGVLQDAKSFYDNPFSELAVKYREHLQAQGYDGIVHGANLEGGTAAIAFEPRQIEIAVGRQSHRRMVMAALARGEAVPESALAAYPDLAERSFAAPVFKDRPGYELRGKKGQRRWMKTDEPEPVLPVQARPPLSRRDPVTRLSGQASTWLPQAVPLDPDREDYTLGKVRVLNLDALSLTGKKSSGVSSGGVYSDPYTPGVTLYGKLNEEFNKKGELRKRVHPMMGIKQAHAEVMTQHLAELLGLEVPEALYLHRGGQIVGLASYGAAGRTASDGDPNLYPPRPDFAYDLGEYERNGKRISLGSSDAPSLQKSGMDASNWGSHLALASIVQDGDRHMGNYLLDAGGQFVGLDYARAFPPGLVIPAKAYGTALGQRADWGIRPVPPHRVEEYGEVITKLARGLDRNADRARGIYTGYEAHDGFNDTMSRFARIDRREIAEPWGGEAQLPEWVDLDQFERYRDALLDGHNNA